MSSTSFFNVNQSFHFLSSNTFICFHSHFPDSIQCKNIGADLSAVDLTGWPTSQPAGRAAASAPPAPAGRRARRSPNRPGRAARSSAPKSAQACRKLGKKDANMISKFYKHDPMIMQKCNSITVSH